MGIVKPTCDRKVSPPKMVAYFEYARDVAGRITRISRETDWAAYYDYDAIDRLTAARWRKNSDSSQIYAFTYEYDAANNRLRHRFEDSAGAEIESGYYSYDAANQLKQRLLQPYDLSTYYGYDANGAILREWDHAAPATTYYEYGANQLVSRVTPPSGSAWNFYYDGQLNRYRIDRGGTDSYMLWDGLNLLEERDGGGNLVARYTHGYSRLPGIGTIVEIYKPGTPDVTYYLCVDHRGTANVLLDEAGDEVGRREYDPFGRIVAESGSWPVDVGYQSNWLMVKIGNKWLCLSKYRIYDPELGIFLSRDFLPYPNKYRAWSNNPINQVDNNGLEESSSTSAPPRVHLPPYIPKPLPQEGLGTGSGPGGTGRGTGRGAGRGTGAAGAIDAVVEEYVKEATDLDYRTWKWEQRVWLFTNPNPLIPSDPNAPTDEELAEAHREDIKARAIREILINGVVAPGHPITSYEVWRRDLSRDDDVLAAEALYAWRQAEKERAAAQKEIELAAKRKKAEELDEYHKLKSVVDAYNLGLRHEGLAPQDWAKYDKLDRKHGENECGDCECSPCPDFKGNFIAVPTYLARKSLESCREACKNHLLRPGQVKPKFYHCPKKPTPAWRPI